AISNTTQANTAELTGVTDFTNTADFVTWFNTSASVDTYLNTSGDFTDPIGTISSTQGEVRSGVSSYSDVIANDTSIDNGNVFNFQFMDQQSSGDTNAFTFHIGANQGQNITMEAINASAAGLGISGVDFLSRENADEA